MVGCTRLGEQPRPVRRERGGRGATDHEPEVPGARARHHPRLADPRQVGHHLSRVRRLIGQRSGQGVTQPGWRHADVSHLILSGAYLRGRFARATTAEEREEAALYLQLARTGWRRADPSLRQVFASQLMPDPSQETWEAFNELQRMTTSTDNVVRFLDVFSHIDVADIVAQVRCPTLVLHARGDVRVPQAQAQEIAARIPGSQLVLLDSRNHILTAAEPAWPVFLDEIDRFLAPG